MSEFNILGQRFSEFVGGENRSNNNREKYGGKSRRRRGRRGGTRKHRVRKTRSRRH